MNSRALKLSVTVAVVGSVLGVGGATLAARAGSSRPVGRARTLFVGNRRIYGFVLGAHRITWISRTHKRGRFPGCEMYVRWLQTGRTLRAPLPSAGCGVKPPVDFAPQAPVLADGVAAWVRGSSCGNTECFWKIATIMGGDTKARVVDSVDIGCPGPACGLRHRVGAAPSIPIVFPRPALAGGGKLLVYSSGGATVDKVFRIVGRRHGLFAVPPGLGSTGGIESLAVGGGAVEVVSAVLDVGDGCGCLDFPAWSPDGSKIAYFHGTFFNQQFEPYPPHVALAVMNADGSGRRDLTLPADLYDQSVSWSPDGSQIAYTSPTGIAVVNADGSGSHQLGSGYDPTWSPDGTKIAFVSAGCDNTTAAISVMNPDGTNIHQLASFAPGPTCVDPTGMTWSPDGTRIAFSLANSGGGETLEMMNADGSNVHPLGTDTLTMAGCSGCRADEPSWSPNSSQIVFRAYDSSSSDDGLWVIGADGSGLHQLTNNQTDEHPGWSPDGQTVVFGSERNDPYIADALPELYFVDPDGSNLRPLSFSKPTTVEQQKTFYSTSGRRLPSFPGLPFLAGKIAAVGSTSSSAAQITLFDARTGTQINVVQVGRNLGHFAVAGGDAHWVVFQLQGTISALNIDSDRIIRLTTTREAPFDLSVSGRRVAWAENINGRGSIRTLGLPR